MKRINSTVWHCMQLVTILWKRERWLMDIPSTKTADFTFILCNPTYINPILKAMK